MNGFEDWFNDRDWNLHLKEILREAYEEGVTTGQSTGYEHGFNAGYKEGVMRERELQGKTNG